jgi:hypothetical protein
MRRKQKLLNEVYNEILPKRAELNEKLKNLGWVAEPPPWDDSEYCESEESPLFEWAEQRREHRRKWAEQVKIEKEIEKTFQREQYLDWQVKRSEAQFWFAVRHWSGWVIGLGFWYWAMSSAFNLSPLQSSSCLCDYRTSSKHKKNGCNDEPSSRDCRQFCC